MWLFLVFGLLVSAVLIMSAFLFFLLTLDNRGTFYGAARTADLDGDGDLDVLLHNVRRESEFTAFSVGTLWLNQGEGRFVPRRLETAVGEGGGWDSAAGDIDQDGDADLLLFMGHHLRTMLNQEGEFKRGPAIMGPEGNGQYGSILLGDLNNDALLDGLIVACCGRLFTVHPADDAPNVSAVWLNKGDGLGPMVSIPALEGLAIPGAALGDLDGDGDLDIYAAVSAPPESRNRDPADRVLLNEGAGNFTDSGQRLGNVDSTAVALGDLDGDGDLDALAGTENGVLLWTNQGKLQGGQAISGDQTRAVFLADLDEDGDLDALIGERRQAVIWWNDGQAGFTRDGQRFRLSKRHNLAIGDFNGDGRPDIFAAAYDDAYKVWFNQGEGIFR